MSEQRMYVIDDDTNWPENVEYHITPVIEGDQTPDEAVASLVEGHAEWTDGMDGDAFQSLDGMLAAFDGIVTRYQAHALTVGARLHVAIHKARKAAP